MKLNKTQMKKIKKLAKKITIDGVLIIGGTIITSNFINAMNEELYLKVHLRIQQRQIQYYTLVHDANLNDYDTKFVNFYRDGFLDTNGKKYKLSELYLMKGLESGILKTYLVSYNEPTLDVINQRLIGDFKRENIYLFKNTNLCYELYKKYNLEDNTLMIPENDINSIDAQIQNFDESLHTLVPETFYLNKIK